MEKLIGLILQQKVIAGYSTRIQINTKKLLIFLVALVGQLKTSRFSIRKQPIPVILTGEPNNYKTKGEFLKLNPQYRNTTSWKECQIVFTNSLDSNTGKMKNARAKGIRIELY